MNESGLQTSVNRYSKKRKSYDIMKSSSIKNGKKSLPEVFIDLNNHTKKTKLTLQEKTRPRDEARFYGEISTFNESRGQRGKKAVKKDHILLKNLYNTEIVKKNDENKNTLNEYRDEIEQLKMDNQHLREENEKLRMDQEYMQRRLKEEKSQRCREVEELRLIQLALEERLVTYEAKIKGLYEQLIRIKKQKQGGRMEERSDFQEQIVLTTLNSENNRARTKGEIRSYREQDQKYSNYQVEVQKYKRLTSPSSHSRDKIDKTITKWGEEQRQYLRRYQQKGEMAYYRAEKVRESGRNSMLQCFGD